MGHVILFGVMDRAAGTVLAATSFTGLSIRVIHDISLFWTNAYSLVK
jgi:hypothetical protein